MIVLTEAHKDFLLDFKSKYIDLLKSRNVDIVPIPIKNNLWILPEELFNDRNYIELKNELIKGGHLQKVTIREVLPEEFTEWLKPT